MAAGDEDFGPRLLGPIHVLAVVSPKHWMPRETALEITELADKLLLRRDYGSRGRFDAACHVARIKQRVVMESAAPHALLALARVGSDVAIVPSRVRIPPGSVHAFRSCVVVPRSDDGLSSCGTSSAIWRPTLDSSSTNWPVTAGTTILGVNFSNMRR